MQSLDIQRFKQDPAHCAVAASASIANYFDNRIDYEVAKNITKKCVSDEISNGLYSGQIGILLNNLGFRKVKVITCDLDIVDYTWANMSKSKLLKEMNRIIRSRSPEVYADKKQSISAMRDFLSNKKYKNSVIVDHHFSTWIRQYLNRQIPVIISFNWTMFFKYPKWGESGEPDPVKGAPEFHAVVARGCDEKGVRVVDSHWELYKHKLKRFKKGYYNVPWEELMTVVGSGDVIIAENFDESLVSHELV